MRRHIGERKEIAVRRGGALLLAMAVLLGILFFYTDGKLRPLVQSYGVQAARRAAMLSVHSGVEEVLSTSESRYSDLVRLQRSATGQILSAEADVAAINLLKAQATDAVIRRIADYENQQIRIPLGSVIGGSFFTGRGPFLKLKIHSSGTVVTTLFSEFSAAGINQTCHRIYLKMKVMMTVLLPMERQSLELETDFLVCETVLIGEVPETYANIDVGENTGLSKIFGSDD